VTAALEQFWNDVLSEDPRRVTRRLAELGEADRLTTLEHLKRMSTETGWTEGQRRRATSALTAWELHRREEDGVAPGGTI